jgi:large subunit ribosomal protein L4
MQVEVLNISGKPTGKSVNLPAEVFGIEPNEHVLWLDVKRFLAAQRQGTHKSKERWELSGSTRKLHKQKGTGGSRKGDINSPTFRGGARVFGPRPRKYDIRLSKNVRMLARCSALSVKAKAGDLIIVEDFTFDAPKTKQFIAILTNLNANAGRSLTLTGEYNKTLYMSCRNIEHAEIVVAKDVNTYQLIKAGKVVIAESAVTALIEMCS